MHPSCLPFQHRIVFSKDRTNDNPIIPPLRNLPAPSDTVQSVLGNHPSRSSWVYQKVVPRASEELGTELRAEIDTKIERKVRQQLDALSAAVLESEIQASLDIARADWIAPLKERMAEMIEKVAPTIINPLLSDLRVSLKKRMFGQVRSLVDRQLPDTDVLVNTVRTQVERVLPLLPEPSPCGVQSGYPLEDT